MNNYKKITRERVQTLRFFLLLSTKALMLQRSKGKLSKFLFFYDKLFKQSWLTFILIIVEVETMVGKDYISDNSNKAFNKTK